MLFTFQKTYDEKFPKMTRNALKRPKIYQKITLNLTMSKNDKKLPIKFKFL